MGLTNVSEKSFKNFKFKDLKVYASDEWMANSSKKYREVFDRAETTYIRVEFSIYNKLFDEEDWTANIVIKAFDITNSKKEELCKFDDKHTISKTDNVFYIREGWGNKKPGSFWTEGNYCWEAYIDGELIAAQEFEIYDVGLVTLSKNPFFNVSHLKLYAGSYDWLEESKRVYLKEFDKVNSKYIWFELCIETKLKRDWSCEVFFNVRDDAGQLKTSIQKNMYIYGKTNKFTKIVTGWGNDTAGSTWVDDKYFLEVVFMDTLVASAEIVLGDKNLEGSVEFKTKGVAISVGQNAVANAQYPEKTLDEVLKDLEALVGLANIKSKIKEHINYLNFLKIRKEKGMQESESIALHSVFTGNPGTGKTTVVKMLGKIYQLMGLLSQGHVVEASRVDLVGEYIGQTAPKTKKMIDQARGGILFIDEAYMLARQNEDSKDYGKEVIEVLLKEMSDGEGDIAIMVAGYPQEMQIFIDSNPGLKSRFSYYFNFEDYTPDELMQISEYISKKKQIVIANEAKDILREIIVEAYRNRNRTFGNARYVNGLVEECKVNLGMRLMANPIVKTLSNDELSTVTKPDVEKLIVNKQKKCIDIDINEKLLQEALFDLSQLTGLHNIKNEINEWTKLVKYYKEIGRPVLNKFSLHSVFIGNPGTGKTTVARIVGNIYKALGLLERGHLVECDRSDLVASYVGQTAEKTSKMLELAKGGVLFIDEAYALSSGSENDFGKEAIETILKYMEDNRGKFAVITAGYTDNMNEFLESNPGLKSRFDNILAFEDYKTDELYAIALNMLKKENLKLDPAAEIHIKNYLQSLFDKRDKYFGNARSVRQMVEQAIKNQNLRMASTEASQRTKEMIESLTLLDVAEFKVTETQQKTRLGFRL